LADKKEPPRGFFFYYLLPEVPTRGVLAVAIPAKKLVEASGVGLEREFLDSPSALRALPVTGEHLTLEASASHAAIAFKGHECLCFAL
jgi:hypothetical protein